MLGGWMEMRSRRVPWQTRLAAWLNVWTQVAAGSAIAIAGTAWLVAGGKEDSPGDRVFLITFAIVCVTMMVVIPLGGGLVEGHRRVRLLRRGVVIQGRLGVVRANIAIDSPTTYTATYHYVVGNREGSATRTEGSDQFPGEAAILYDPDGPDLARVIDELELSGAVPIGRLVTPILAIALTVLAVARYM
jgi:hypothetical protein